MQQINICSKSRIFAVSYKIVTFPLELCGKVVVRSYYRSVEKHKIYLAPNILSSLKPIHSYNSKETSVKIES